jgi:hypothetical protein
MKDLLWTQKHFELVAEEIYQYGLIENGFTKKSQFRHGDVVKMTNRLKRRFMSHGLRIPSHDGIKIVVRCGCQHQRGKKNESVLQRVYVIKLMLHSKGYVLAR